MRGFFLMIWMSVVGATILSGQSNFFIDQENGNSLTVCNGTLFDSGGSSQDYGPNENFVVTFCPPSGDQVTRLSIYDFGMGRGDQICLYDGASISAPQLNCVDDFYGILPFVYQASNENATGCLTLSFTSDGILEAAGFEINIDCAFRCQQMDLQLLSTTPVADIPLDGVVNICPGDQVQFDAAVSFPENGNLYVQSEGQTDFYWLFGDNLSELESGLSVSHQYDEPGGYEVSLIAVDQNNCSDTIVLETAVQVSPGVQFEDVFAEAITVFLGDTIQLSGDVLPKTSYFLPPNTFTEDVFLPDGTGEAVEVIFNFDEFGDEDTLEVVDDEFSICITMEHSWMHDNEIEVECPNGQSILLQDQQFLGEIFQGIPDENDNLPLTDPTVNLPGTGYQYCWTNASTNGTWTEWFQANPSQNPTLPVGDYDSFEPLSGLEGCPLGGDWTLRIRDKWNIDNGWLFAISLGFNPELFPDPDSFATDAVVKEWEFVPGAIGTVNEQMMIAASTPGINDFTFKVLDNFGCALDTTIAVTVLDSTNCNLALEVDVASPNPPFGGFIDLSSQGGVPPYTFLWSNGATTEDIADLIEDTYSVTLTDALGCQLVATVFGEATSTTEISSLEEFTLAPNPSSERSMLTLRFNQPEALRLELVNALGQIVHQEAFVNVSFLQKEINLKAYPPGIYFVRLIANDEVSTQSLIRTD